MDSSRTNRQWLLAARPGRQIRDEDFRWAISPVPSPTEGQVLVRNLWLVPHPTAILFTSEDSGALAIPIGGVMRSGAAGRIVQSRLNGFEPGDLVSGHFGWEDYTVTNGRDPSDRMMEKIPPGVPLNLALGTLGITGMAAYFGVTEVGAARAGETFVVTSAAGGVGSIAGQIAKIRGLRVIGITTGKERRDALVHELGFDAAIDSQTEDVGSRLSELCPGGIDVFFDNAGRADLLDSALTRLHERARVVLCGATSIYLASEMPPGPKNVMSIIMKRGRIEGLLAIEYADRFPEAREAMSKWLNDGQLKSFEDVVVGLENAPRAMQRVFSGANRGKQLLKIADE